MPSTATLTLLTLALACAALADVRYVSPFGDDSNTPCTDPSSACKTMTAAHTAANDGDSINVGGGTYTGAINLIKITKSVSIVAAAGTTPLNCVFDGQQQNAPGFSVSGNVTVKFVGIGFRGFAEYCSYQDCVVGAVDISDGESMLYVQSCLFFSNTNAITARAGTLFLQDTQIQDSANAGLLISSSQSSLNYIRISNVTIVRGNQGVVLAKSNVQFKATSLFIHNMINAISAQSNYVSNFDVNVASSEFNNNTESAFYFPGISGSVTAAFVTISNTQFRFNGGQQNNGGALFIGSNTALAMQNSNLIGNIVTNRGGAIFCDSLATVNLMNVDVSDNQANDGAAGWCSPQCAFVATSSTSYNNKETQNTGPCAGI